MNENKQKTNKGLIVLIVILIILVVGMGSYIVYDKILDKQEIEEKEEIVDKEEEIEDDEDDDDEEEADEKEEIINLYKNKVKESSNLVDNNNIKDWIVTKVIYHGYSKTDSDEKYYNIIGYFSCKDGNYSCLYQDQVGEKSADGTYPFNQEVIIKNNNIILDGEYISDDVVSVEEEID